MDAWGKGDTAELSSALPSSASGVATGIADMGVALDPSACGASFCKTGVWRIDAVGEPSRPFHSTSASGVASSAADLIM